MPAPDHNRIASLFAVLTCDVRIRIIVALAKGGSVTVGDLAKATGASRYAISNNLVRMRLLGIVESDRDGKTRPCRLAQAWLDEVQTFLDSLRIQEEVPQ